MSEANGRLIATVFTVQAVAVGTSFGAAPVLMAPIRESFGASIAQVSWGVSLIALMLGVMGPLWGRWMDGGAYRRIMLTGCAIASACLFAASFAPSLGVMALLCVGMGVAVPLIGPLAGSSLIGKAFAEARGRAMGIASMGPPAGGAVFAVLAGELVPRIGWRATFQVLAGVCLLTMALVAWQVPRRIQGAGGPGVSPWPARRLLRTPDFWAAGLTIGIAAGVATGWSYHTVSFVLDLGHDLAAGSRIAAVAGGVGILGTLAFGLLADRHPPRTLLIGTLLGQVVAFAVFWTGPAYGGLLATALLFGICGGSVVALFALVLTQRFGAASLGGVLGLTNVFIVPFGVACSPLAGWLRDRSGSYGDAILALAALLVVAAVSLSLIRGLGGAADADPASPF